MATTAQTPILHGNNDINQLGSTLQFVVNGVKVQVTGNAKNVNIGKNSMEISF
jgi:hypothetical protein